MPPAKSPAGFVGLSRERHAALKQDATCSRASIVSIRYWPKEIGGTRWGPKKIDFFFRGRETPYGPWRPRRPESVNPCQKVSLGSPRVGTIHVQAPTPHAPALQAFLADFSQQTLRLGFRAGFASRALEEHCEPPHRWRMRYRRLPTIRATPVGVQGADLHPKK